MRDPGTRRSTAATRQRAGPPVAGSDGRWLGALERVDHASHVVQDRQDALAASDRIAGDTVVRATRAGAATWMARPTTETAASPLGAARWGVVHVPSSCWVVVGSGGRCRAVAAQLTRIDALRRRRDAAGAWPEAAPGDRPAPAAGPPGTAGVRTLRHRSGPPEPAGGGGTLWLLAAGLVVVIVVALGVMVGSVAADELAVLVPGQLLATWAAR